MDAQDILTARLRANLERRNGNEVAGQAWDAEADELEHRMILAANRDQWDAMKGSPEHDGWGNG
jgi:hypothetical protein